MTEFECFSAAIRDLLALRSDRLAALPSADRLLQVELAAVKIELRQLLVTDAASREAAGRAFAELVRIFGSTSEVWAQYPDAAGLVLALRTPGAREGVHAAARLARS